MRRQFFPQSGGNAQFQRVSRRLAAAVEEEAEVGKHPFRASVLFYQMVLWTLVPLVLRNCTLLLLHTVCALSCGIKNSQ